MKKSTINTLVNRFSLLSILVVFCLWLASCGGDDDTTLPEISFTDLTSDLVVWNTIPIKVDAKDNEGISTIAIFIDNNLVQTLVQTPYEVNWDSNTVPDGAHTVKAVVTDKSGNKAEGEVTIIVKNILVKIDIADDQFLDLEGTNERGFVFLSDETGKVIASVEYNNGQRLEIKSPTFDGGKFFLTEVLVYDRNGTSNDYVTAWTFADIERGEKWVVLSNNNEGEDDNYAGEATLNFTNIAPSAQYRAYSNGDEAFADEENTSSTIMLRKNPSRLFVVREPDEVNPPKFGMFSTITTGTNTVNLDLVNQALTKVTTAIPNGAGFASIEVTAYPNANSYTEPYYLGQYYEPEGNNLVVYHPGNAFAHYMTNSYYQTEGLSYDRTSRTGFGDFSMPTHTVNFSFANNKITYSATGNYDVVAAYFGDDETNSWGFILPLGTNLSVPVLEVPVALAGINLPAMGIPKNHGVYDFADLSNYNDLKTFIRASAYSIMELTGDGKTYVTVDYYNSSSSSGRKKSNTHVGLRSRIKKRR